MADFFFYSLFKIDVTHIIVRLFIYNIPMQIDNDDNAYDNPGAVRKQVVSSSYV